MVTAIVQFDVKKLEELGKDPNFCASEVTGRIFDINGIDMFKLISHNLEIPLDTFEIIRMSSFLLMADNGEIPSGKKHTFIQMQ